VQEAQFALLSDWKNIEIDTIQSREYRMGGKLDTSHLSIQFHIQPQLFWMVSYLDV